MNNKAAGQIQTLVKNKDTNPNYFTALSSLFSSGLSRPLVKFPGYNYFRLLLREGSISQ